MMNGKSLLRNLVAFAILIVTTGIVTAPVAAQDKKPAHKTANHANTTAKMYECKECKLKFTAAEAKKKGFKCDCGCKLVVVKATKTAAMKKKG